MGKSSRMIWGLFSFVVCGLAAQGGWAQAAEGAGKNSLFEFHTTAGAIVTNVHGVDATVTVVGVRGAYTPSFGNFEVGVMSGRGAQNVQYTSIPLNYRVDVQAAGVGAYASLGGRVDIYKTNDETGNESRMGNGWQVGGGLILDMSDSIAARGDFEIRLSPGMAVYAGAALVFRF